MTKRLPGMSEEEDEEEPPPISPLSHLMKPPPDVRKEE
jgi:hypothetical protein